jgi:uncharacterized protein YbjT (DUF2867 family)
MIIVTGANGRYGRLVAHRLLARVPAERIGVSVREPAKAKELAERGMRVRRGDFTDPASLADAFEGATQVLIVSVDALGESAVAQHRAAIEAAAAAGARRVLYTSHMGASRASRFQACRDHAATEDALRNAGIPFTALRNGFYASSAARFLGQTPATGRIALPEDGPVSWTAHADLAEAAATILADEGRFDGPTPPLTAEHAYDFAAIAPLLERITGRRATRSVVPDEEFRDSLLGHGAPEAMSEALLGIFQASRAGEFAATDPALAALIGRPPIGLEQALAEHLSPLAG